MSVAKPADPEVLNYFRIDVVVSTKSAGKDEVLERKKDRRGEKDGEMEICEKINKKH